MTKEADKTTARCGCCDSDIDFDQFVVKRKGIYICGGCVEDGELDRLQEIDDRTGIPLKPGYYWAKWRIPADGTHEGTEQTPSDKWEIVQVNENSVDWDRDPTADEALSVSVPGVRETQWRDCFVWGDFVSPLTPDPNAPDVSLLCPKEFETATGHFDPAGYNASECAGCGCPKASHTAAIAKATRK